MIESQLKLKVKNLLSQSNSKSQLMIMILILLNFYSIKLKVKLIDTIIIIYRHMVVQSPQRLTHKYCISKQFYIPSMTQHLQVFRRYLF